MTYPDGPFPEDGEAATPLYDSKLESDWQALQTEKAAEAARLRPGRPGRPLDPRGPSVIPGVLVGKPTGPGRTDSVDNSRPASSEVVPLSTGTIRVAGMGDDMVFKMPSGPVSQLPVNPNHNNGGSYEQDDSSDTNLPGIFGRVNTRLVDAIDGLKDGLKVRASERWVRGEPVSVQPLLGWQSKSNESNNGGLDMTQSQGDMAPTTMGNSLVPLEDAVPELGYWKRRDLKYADLIEQSADTNRFLCAPKVSEDVETLLAKHLPPSISNSTVGDGLRMIAHKGADGTLASQGGEAQKPKNFIEDWTSKILPYKIELQGNLRKLKVAETAGSFSVSNVLDLSFAKEGEKFPNEASVREGFGVLGLEVHEDTLHGRLLVSGFDAAQKMMAATREGTDRIIATHVNTYEVERPGENCMDFEATVLVRGLQRSRHLLTMRPVNTQTPGQKQGVDLMVEGVALDLDVSELVVTHLNGSVELKRVNLGHGVDCVSSSLIDADFEKLLADLSDPKQIGIPISKVTPGGNQPLQIESLVVIDADIVD